jgi:uncharacterized protein
MDSILLILGFISCVIGIFGSFLPALPGPGLSWLGILLLYLTKAVPENYWVLGVSLFITVAIIVLDYVIPAKGTKKFGGSKYGIIGTNIGLLVGLLVIPIPFGFVLGAFAGAFFGEMYYDKQNQKRAIKAATGSFLGFLLSALMKFTVCMIFLVTFLVVVWQNKSALFS